MAAKKGVTKRDAPREGLTKRGSVIILGDSVRVWSEVGVTIAVTDEPPQFLRFTFGHERIAKSSSQADVVKAEALVDEFNEKILDKRLKKYRRMFRSSDVSETAKEGPRERAAKRIKKGKK